MASAEAGTHRRHRPRPRRLGPPILEAPLNRQKSSIRVPRIPFQYMHLAIGRGRDLCVNLHMGRTFRCPAKPLNNWTAAHPMCNFVGPVGPAGPVGLLGHVGPARPAGPIGPVGPVGRCPASRLDGRAGAGSMCKFTHGTHFPLPGYPTLRSGGGGFNV